MKSLEALTALQTMRTAAFTTADAAARLHVSNANASKMLERLEAAGQLVRLRRGLWFLGDRVDPLALPEYLTAPFPSYVSLQSALYLRGMIDQVPAIIYAVSLARTERITTPVGTVSIHHVAPAFFVGFEPTEAGGRLATAEKALVDYLYLSPARSKLFRALPEIDLPRTFRRQVARSFLTLIASPGRRALVSEKLERIFAAK